MPGANDQIGSNPDLGPLQDNGGPTFTHALLPGSPAIDVIPNGTNDCGVSLTVDQRGGGRPFPFDSNCDVGAFEAGIIFYDVFLPLILK
jgi:hypothetical protein